MLLLEFLLLLVLHRWSNLAYSHRYVDQSLSLTDINSHCLAELPDEMSAFNSHTRQNALLP